MTFAAEILTYYLKHSDAIASELTASETQPLALALKDYAMRWGHAEALLKNPLLLERGAERYQAETAAFPVMEAMMFAARTIPADGATYALYTLPSLETEDIRVHFIDQLIEKRAEQWVASCEVPSDSSVKVKWGCFTHKPHERTLKLYLRRGKVVREREVTSGIPWRQRIMGEDLRGILRQWEHVLAGVERLLSWDTSWPNDVEVAARRTADAIVARATPEELELLRGRSEMLIEALHSVLYFKKAPESDKNR